MKNKQYHTVGAVPKCSKKIVERGIIDTPTGADPEFQVRGGGALKKIVPSRGRRENCWGISCEKSQFYTKKSYFLQF